MDPEVDQNDSVGIFEKLKQHPVLALGSLSVLGATIYEVGEQVDSFVVRTIGLGVGLLGPAGIAGRIINRF